MMMPEPVHHPVGTISVNPRGDLVAGEAACAEQFDRSARKKGDHMLRRKDDALSAAIYAMPWSFNLGVRRRGK